MVKMALSLNSNTFKVSRMLLVATSPSVTGSYKMPGGQTIGHLILPQWPEML